MLKLPKIMPDRPGIYIFRHANSILYIGKALNLKKRLGSYFQKRADLPAKIQMMLAEADRLETIKTASEIEALLKEAELIKKYRPKYNLLMRDDKSYFYVAVSREQFPRIFVTHQPREKSTNSESITNIRMVRRGSPQVRKFAKDSLFVDERRRLKTRAPRLIGPFTSGTTLKAVLKLLRRIFPYCTCKKPHKRPCLNSEIGRCPGYCCPTSEIRDQRLEIRNRHEYRRNIRNIIAVLGGKRTRLIVSLKRQMKEAARQEKFEQAARLRDAVFGLEDIFAHRKVLHAPEMRPAWPTMQSKLQSLLKTKKTISRIEGYDISNISGREATGSMVVFSNGAPDKSQYRKFRIKTVSKISDVDMLKEVLRRRFKHPEWPYPELIVIDGGKPQLGVALSALRKSEIRNPKSEIPIVTALAKRKEILFLENGRGIAMKRQDPALLHLFQRIRDESHRFARAYHHKLREKVFKRNI